MKRKEHETYEKALLGPAWRKNVDLILDDPEEIRAFGNRHRKVTHTWSRLEAIKDLYGEDGLAQAWIHLWLDYGI